MLDQLKAIWNSTLSGIPFPKIWGVLIIGGIILLGLTFLPEILGFLIIAVLIFAVVMFLKK